MQESSARQLLTQAKIATWNRQSDQITYVEEDTVYVLSIDQGATPVPLFSHPNLNWLHARWSPDGLWIVVSEADGQSDETLWLIPTNGETPRELTTVENLQMEHSVDEITWSYDSQFLLVRHDLFNLAGENVTFEFSGKASWLPNQLLLLINGDDGLQMTTVDGSIIAIFGNTFSTAWAFSHDRQQLAYAQILDDERVNIFIFDMETQQNEWIGSLPLPYLNLLRWSNDDQYLIMDDGQNENPIWKMASQPDSIPEDILSNGVLIEVIPVP